MISINDLHKSFGKVKVLEGIDLDLTDPGIYAVLGPNGSGKTTMIKCILGMVIPDHGTISVNGSGIRGNWKYRKDIDYLPQIAQFPGNLTVKEILRMIKNLRGQSSSDQSLIDRFDLRPYMDKKLSNLSGGTRQKVNIVLALMFDCHMMILDEPTTGLDPVSLIQLKELIQEAKERGKIILITSHIMSFVEEVSDEVLFILEGRVRYKGSVEALREQTGQTDLEHAIAKLLIENHV
ncbi:MAG: ABC transporter ATP-binding protein [Bacteroidetes bacterium]|nr:ABC transporter ATP-binding protein [Bacteroidota bacterium]